MKYLQFVEKDNAKVQIGWILEVPNDLSRDEVLKAIRKGYKPKDKMKITYLCDREKCERCSYPTCERTSDIMHAKNFMVFHDCDGELLGATEIELEGSNPFEPLSEMPDFAKKKLNI